MGTKLTKSLVEKLEPGPKPTFVWDTTLLGFGLKITPAGRKVYVLQFRPKQSRITRRYTLGPHGQPWTTESARSAAADLLARVRLGEDPFLSDQHRRHEEREAQRQDADARDQAVRERFERVFAEFVERHSKRFNRTWRETVRIIEYDVLPAWADRSVRSIARTDVLALLDEIENRSPSSARAVHAQLRKFFSWCLERLYVDTSPCAGLGSRTGVVGRDRWLRPREIVLVWEAFGQIGPPFGPLFKLLLLTAQKTRRGRRNELARIGPSECHMDDPCCAFKEWRRAYGASVTARSSTPDAAAAIGRVCLHSCRRSSRIGLLKGQSPSRRRHRVAGHNRE
jgi:hypothetical protein